MNCKAGFLCLCFWCLTLVVNGQQPLNGKWRLAAVPPESVGVAVVSQPDCPVQIENAKLFYDVEGEQPIWSYDLYNRGTKPLNLRSVNVEILTTHGMWATLNGWASKTGTVIMPNEKLSPENNYIIEEVPFTEEMREKLKLKGEMQGIVFFKVGGMWFTDDTKYNAKSLSQVLDKYLKDVSDKVERAERLNRPE